MTLRGLLLLVFSSTVTAESFDFFRPDLNITLPSKPSCGYDEVASDDSYDYDSSEEDETVPNVVKQNACPLERPPRILLMEISTRFFDLLEGGDEAQPGKNLRSRKGTFFKAAAGKFCCFDGKTAIPWNKVCDGIANCKMTEVTEADDEADCEGSGGGGPTSEGWCYDATGSCYEFLSIPHGINTPEVIEAMNDLFTHGRLNKILFVVDFDIIDEVSTSVTLKTQMKVLSHLFGQDIFKHLLVVLGHEHGSVYTHQVKSRAIEMLTKELLDDSDPALDLKVMSGRDGFYERILSDPTIKRGLQGHNIPVASLQGGKAPYFFPSDKTPAADEVFTIASYFSAPESTRWKAEWTLSGSKLWTIAGPTGSSPVAHHLPHVDKTTQEVKHVIGPLHYAKLSIRAKISQPQNFTLSLQITSNPSGTGPLSASTELAFSVFTEWGGWMSCDSTLQSRRRRTTTDGKKSETETKKCNITGLTQPNFCKQFGYPGKRILLLGATGVGKSTLGNLLFGVNKGGCEEQRCIKCKAGMCRKKKYCEEFDPKTKQCIRCQMGKCKEKKGGCEEWECLKRHNYQLGQIMPASQPLPFEPGGGIDSKTVITKPMPAQFLGSGPCVTLIDTPGAADTKGRDYKHAIEMANMLKEELKPSELHVILITLKGTDRRFDAHTLALLKLYEEIFGKAMWRNVVVEMSYWGHTKTDYCARHNNYLPALDEDKQRQDIQNKLKEQFQLNFAVPVIFIDPVMKAFHPAGHPLRERLEEREEKMFRSQTKALWLLAELRRPYKCSENCQAPSNFYIGEPWIKMGDEEVEEGQVNFEITCKIWDGIPITDKGSSKNSDEITWKFNDSPLLIKSKGKNVTYTRELLEMYNIEAFPPQSARGSMFAVSKLVIKRVKGEVHGGSYTCENSKGFSTWKLSIPFWSQWGSWSQCTKECKTYPGGAPGTRSRSRVCNGHKDEATTCSKSEHGASQEEPCTGNQGKAETFCRVPPVVEPWSTWTSCTAPCDGGSRTRTKVCTEGKFGLNPIDDLCPTPGHARFLEENEVCNTHECEVDCEWYNWGNWGACSQTCRKGTTSGTKTRERKIKTQSKGTGKKCEAISEDTATCGQWPECPVNGHWSSWKKEGVCWNERDCIDDKISGRQKYERTCVGQVGAGKLCLTRNGHRASYEAKEEPCRDMKTCPIDCKLSEWSEVTCRVPCEEVTTQYSTRFVVVEPQHGGKACGEVKRAHVCEGQECPSILGKIAAGVAGGGGAVALGFLLLG